MENNIKIIIDPALKALFGFLIKGTFSEIKRIIKEYADKTQLITTEKELYDNIINELRATTQWATVDLFSNHQNNLSVFSRYVHLDLLLEPRKYHSKEEQLLNKKSLTDIITSEKSNIIILGQPGSGKTTSIKYIINSLLHDPYFLGGIYCIPIVIKLRDLNKTNSILGENQTGGIFEKLSYIFGLNINIKSTEKDDDKDKLLKLKKILISKLIPSILDNQKILLILDGFDEISDDSIRDLVISEIRELSKSLNTVNFILSSRSVDFKIRLEGAEIFEICELTNAQLKDFSLKWFEDEKLADDFLIELFQKTPYKDFYRRPLLITHLAGIYSRTQELPDKPKLIYETIIDLVLKEWNENQGIKRKSRYSSFSPHRKGEFLSTIAYYLTIKYNKRVFSKSELLEIYNSINSKFKELPLSEADEVIEEIESHNGIILRTGLNKFEFSHLTIQEFLVGKYISKGGSLRLSSESLLKIPNELAVAVALSSDPTIMLYDLLIEKVFKDNSIHIEFIEKFFNRIKLEKPDFEISPIFSIVLLTIYTKLANLDNETIEYNGDRIEFEKFISKNLNPKFIDELLEYYTIDNNNYKTKNKFEYLGLRKLKNPPNEFHQFNFPKYLLWNKAIYDKEYSR